jgi:PKHD-type hydroxylase
MKGEWCYFGKHFSVEMCEKILELGLKIPSQDAAMGLAGVSEVKSNDYRRSKVRFLESSNSDFDFLFDDIWKMGIQANHEWFNFHITNLSFIQLAEYDSLYKGEYKRHHDVFWINNSIYHRKLTCVIQLSDPNTYKGGDFEIFNQNQKPNKAEIREQGTVIFIPSFIEHQATPVTHGTRYSLAVWFEGPKWV